MSPPYARRVGHCPLRSRNPLKQRVVFPNLLKRPWWRRLSSLPSRHSCRDHLLAVPRRDSSRRSSEWMPILLEARTLWPHELDIRTSQNDSMGSILGSGNPHETANRSRICDG
jgi:hypothetical protein